MLTAGGVTAGLDLALWIVEQVAESDVAAAVETELEHERSADVVSPDPSS